MHLQLVAKTCGCEGTDLPDNPVVPGQNATVGMLINPLAEQEKPHRATLRLVWPDQSELIKLTTESG
jgi:hypothetical protein